MVAAMDDGRSNMRVLVTNDDGIGSPGLHALAEAVFAAGHDPVVVAPAVDNSGCGGSIGAWATGARITHQRATLPSGMGATAVDGPPALCVIAACVGAFGRRPDAVVSGVNPGTNTGRAVLHSGTVAAALTALTFGRPAVAVSLAVADVMHWDAAARMAVAPLPWLAQQPGPLALSVNVPDLAVGPPLGVRAASLADAGIVQATVAAPEDGSFELHLPAETPLDPSSDTSLVLEGFVTVTLVAGLERVGGDDQHLAAAMVAHAIGYEESVPA
jgi:5'-nucleotidase